MATSSRSNHPNSQPPVNEYYLDSLMFNEQQKVLAAREVVEQLVTNGAKILHMKYIQSQIKPYASKTLARELIMNASWALAPIDCNEVIAEPDEDLALPVIDEWAGGVLPVRGPDSAGLRTAVTPARETRRTLTANSKKRKETPNSEQQSVSRAAPSMAPSHVKRATTAQNKENRKPKPQLTEAQIISKTFEEARKKTNMTMKAVTVNADFSVIQIQEPKGLPPALIVPKVTTKKVTTRDDNSSNLSHQIRQSRSPVIRKPEKPKRKAKPSLLEPDQPIFDEEVMDNSTTDKFVCSPGVTFKDGSVVKSRPPTVNTSQMTRAQFEQYLNELRLSSE